MKTSGLLWLGLLLASLNVWADIAGWSMTVNPARPIALEPVYARVAINQTCPLDPLQTRIRHEVSAIVVTISGLGSSCLPTGGQSVQDLSLGQFHAGQFSVVVRSADGVQLTAAQFEVVDSRAQGDQSPQINFSDLWWNPQESGWGIGITHHASGRVFVTWYTYAQNEAPLWFTLQPGEWTSINTYTGPIYRTSGPYYGNPFNASQITITRVGTGTLTFDSPSSALFAYTLEGVSSSRRIERMIF